jgi:hypothetical protein
MHALEVIIAKNQAPELCEICGGDHRTKLPEETTRNRPTKIVRISLGRGCDPVILSVEQEPASEKTPFRADAEKLYELLFNTIPWRTYAALKTLIEAEDSPKKGRRDDSLYMPGEDH